MNHKPIEKPVVGYIAITCALLAGLIVTTALGQSPAEVPSKGLQQADSIQSRLIPQPLDQPKWLLGGCEPNQPKRVT